MYSVLFFSFIIILLNKTKCSYVFHNNKLDRISDNIDMLMKPIKKISGIFPNHEFELQFDLEQVDTDSSRQTKYKHPLNAIMRTKNISKAEFTTPSADDFAPVSYNTSDPDNHIVYMKDLKNALEEYEKKHVTGDCVKKELTTEPTNLLSSFNDNPALSDVLQLIKRGAKLQYDTPKPGDSDLSWIKIRVPTA